MTLNFIKYKFKKGEEKKALLQGIKHDIEELIKIFSDQKLSDDLNTKNLHTMHDIDDLSEFLFINKIDSLENLWDLYIIVCDAYDCLLSELDRFHKSICA